MHMLCLYAKRHGCLPPPTYPGGIGFAETRNPSITGSARPLLRAQRGGTYPMESIQKRSFHHSVIHSVTHLVLTSRSESTARLFDVARSGTPMAPYYPESTGGRRYPTV
jgi:hypothetical protein